MNNCKERIKVYCLYIIYNVYVNVTNSGISVSARRYDTTLYNMHTNLCILFPIVVFWSVDVGDDDKRGQSVSWCGPLWHYNISDARPSTATATILLWFPVWFYTLTCCSFWRGHFMWNQKFIEIHWSQLCQTATKLPKFICQQHPFCIQKIAQSERNNDKAW